MKRHKRTFNRRARGFTAADLITVAAMLAVLLLLYPVFIPCRSPNRARRINCLSNLKMVGWAFRIWSNDHADKSPMSVSTNAGGALEFVESGEVFRIFQVLSNQLYRPTSVACPSDKNHKPAEDFASLTDTNISFFVGLDTDETHPQAILSGDRNISTNRQLMSGILTLPTKNKVRWTADIHKNNGDLGLADGTAIQTSDATLAKAIADMTANMTNNMRFAIP